MHRPLQTLLAAAFVVCLAPIAQSAAPSAKFIAWVTEGESAIDMDKSFRDAPSLRLKRSGEKLERVRAASPRMDASVGHYEVQGALAGDLYSPDMSFNVSLDVEFLDGNGKILEKTRAAILCGKRTWDLYRKRVRAPKRTAGVRFSVEFNKTHGVAWVSLPTLKRVHRPAGEDIAHRAIFDTGRVGFLYYPHDDLKATMRLEVNGDSPTVHNEVIYNVRDYWGVSLSSMSGVPLIAKDKNDKGWSVYEAAFDLTALPLVTGPYYELHTLVVVSGGTQLKDVMSFAILPEARNKIYDHAEIPFGAHSWDARLHDYFALSGRLGLSRCLTFWDWPAEEPNEPSFDEGWGWDSRFGWPQEAGMRPFGVLYPVTEIERGNHKHNEASLRAGIRNSILKYKKHGLWGFQIGNEPPQWDQKMIEADVEAYRIIYDEIKKTDPEIFAIGSAIGPSEPFFKAGFGAYCDAYNIHAYSDLGELRAGMRAYKELFKKYGHPKPIYATEIGSKSQGLSRHQIAIDIVRKPVCFFADGGSFFVWFATGGYPDPEGKGAGSYGDSMNLFDSRFNMHMVRLDAVAYYHIINSIGPKTFVEEKVYEVGVSAFLFRDAQGESLQVLWNPQTKDEREYFIPLVGASKVALTHVDGRYAELDAKGKGVTLRIGQDPVMLLYRGSSEALAPQLGTPALTLDAFPEKLSQGAAVDLAFRVRDGDAPSVTLSGPPLWDIQRMSVDSDIARFRVLVPENATARHATFAAELSESSRLQFRLPVGGRIEVGILPLPSRKDGEAGVELTLVNNGTSDEEVEWRVELVSQVPMQGGAYQFASAVPAAAYFLNADEGTALLSAGARKTLDLVMADVDPLAIYRVRAVATEASGKTSTRERLIGGFAAAPKTKGAIVLDGKLDEADWGRARVIHLDRAEQHFATRDAAEWTGPDDLSAELRFLWDEGNLYVGVEVTDDVFANPGSDGLMWNMDGLQFLVDPFRAETETKGRYDYSLGLGQNGNQAWCHMSGDSRAPAGEAREIEVHTRRTTNGKGGITYEVAFPWTRLAPFAPALGADLGLAMIINEDDGKGRSEFLGWFSGVHLKKVGHVGDLILTE